ncbi:MAG TPA: M3 family metallopeptidase [Bacteroidales bacterium]|nr:M3 family metallopeptidase [Bacteroidales bacterium]
MFEYNTTFQSVPFDKIRTEHYKPAFESLIAECRETLDRITSSPEEPDFLNTIEHLERHNYSLKRLEQTFFNINAAETSETIQQLAQEISPMLTAFYNDITLNEPLFERVKKVYEKRSVLKLNTEQTRLLEETYKMFVRNGANLAPSAKEEYRKLTEELSALTLKFDENVLAETNDFKLHLTDEKDLAGLPEFVKEAAALEAKSKGLEGWLFTLKMPSYTAFMKYADNRELRQKMFMAYSARSFRENEKDNREVIRRIVDIRLKLANLLGYKTYAGYVLEERMAKNPETVKSFLNDLISESKPAAQKEYAELQDFAKSTGADFKIQRWDWAYYSEKLRNSRFSITDEMIKPYFHLEKVESGIFNLAGKLYGISFEPENTIPVYNKDVRTFRVLDQDGSFLALLYVDYFPRDGKQGGAWMTNYLEQYKVNGEDIRPHVSLVLNFTKPTDTKPSLLTYEEVRTFLHEFGHALHSIFSDCNYMGLSGTNVYRDFVELPSQIMENWTEQKEWLHEVAVHYQTGQPMPEEMIDNILKSRNFNSGYAFVRQLSFGLNDMAWHTLEVPLDRPVQEFETSAMALTELFPPVPGTCMSTAFHHIFGGGYAAGYYGYKWAEVLDADAFSVFKQKGIFDRATAKSFRDNILSKGGTEDPMVLYKRFRGQEPSVEALLERAGLRGK